MQSEPKKKMPISVQLPDDLLQRTNDEAKRRGVSRSVVIRWSLVHYLESLPPEVAPS